MSSAQLDWEDHSTFDTYQAPRFCAECGDELVLSNTNKSYDIYTGDAMPWLTCPKYTEYGNIYAYGNHDSWRPNRVAGRIIYT